MSQHMDKIQSVWTKHTEIVCNVLTLNMRGPSYLGLSRSIYHDCQDISSHDIDYVE